MKKTEFNKLLESIQLLNNGQFRQVKELINNIESINFVSTELETPTFEICCGHCKSNNFRRWGKQSDLQRYKCKSCGKTFNSLTGTPLARLKKKGHWLDYSQCIIEGLSVRESARICNVHRNTTFKWRHRFLKNSLTIKPKKLSGIIEIMNLKFKKSFKGNKAPINRGKETIDVIFNQNRNLEIYNSILESLNQQTLSKSLSEIYSKDSLLLSNNNKEIQIFSFKFNINHIDCNSNQEKNYIHTTNINSYCLNMLLWLKRFRGVATKYLDNYLSWYRELDELGKCITPNIVLIRAKSGDLYKKQL